MSVSFSVKLLFETLFFLPLAAVALRAQTLSVCRGAEWPFCLSDFNENKYVSVRMSVKLSNVKLIFVKPLLWSSGNAVGYEPDGPGFKSLYG